MPRPFKDDEIGPAGPAIGSFVITPSDAVDLPSNVRGVTIGGGGTIAWHNWDGVAQATGVLPAGDRGMTARRILATGTTATDITGWI